MFASRTLTNAQYYAASPERMADAIAQLAALVMGVSDESTQATWHVRPSTGSDANNGLTSASPVATGVELSNRLGRYNRIAQATTVNLPEGLPATDALSLIVVFDDLNASGAGILAKGGVKTTLGTGTFTSAPTAENPATNTTWSVVNSALPSANSWAALVGKRIRITSGPRVGLMAWILKDLGSKTARTSEWAVVDAWPGLSVTLGTPQSGDAYAVEDLQQVSLGAIDTLFQNIDYNDPGFPNISFQDLEIRDAGLFQPRSLADIRFYGCTVVPQLDASYCQYALALNTHFVNGIVVNHGGQCVAYAGSSFGDCVASTGGQFRPDGNFIAQGANIMSLDTGGLVLGKCAALDSDSGIVSVGGGAIQLTGGPFGAGVCWGSGGSGNGLTLAPGGKVMISGFNPSNRFYITGANGDYSGGTDVGDPFDASPLMYAFDSSASPPGWTTGRTCTWANYFAAIADGGFAQSAHHPGNNTMICRQYT